MLFHKQAMCEKNDSCIERRVAGGTVSREIVENYHLRVVFFAVTTHS